MTSLTYAERALELFRQRPPDENRIDWLANQLLMLAAESQSPSLRIAAPGEGDGRVLECSDSVQAVTSSDPGPLRVFRTLLARLAKMAEEENGAAFDPYGGKLHFDRTGPGGPVRLSVEFGNTTTTQLLTMSKASPDHAASPGTG
jgi:hypothetical protein